MSYTQLTARITDQMVQMTNIPLLASGSEGVLQIKGTFCDRWSGYTRTAVFYRTPEDVYHVLMVDDVATIPHEVLAEEGHFFLGFLGTADNTRTTEVVRLELKQGALRVATTSPKEPTPDIYQQLLSAYNVMDSRVAEALAMRSTGGVSEFILVDEYISGVIKSNGAHAYIAFTISDLSLIAGGAHTSDYCIPPELAPLGAVYLESSNADINVTLEPASAGSAGWARLLIENVSSEYYTTDMVTFVNAYYPLASVSISELADVRVGYDGTTHNTAGNAVRNQMRALDEKMLTLDQVLLAHIWEKRDTDPSQTGMTDASPLTLAVVSDKAVDLKISKSIEEQNGANVLVNPNIKPFYPGCSLSGLSDSYIMIDGLLYYLPAEAEVSENHWQASNGATLTSFEASRAMRVPIGRLGIVASLDRNAYPDNGEADDGCWYVYKRQLAEALV